MSFRDTFTRGDSSSENLQYDDKAAYHFYVTILLLVFLPLSYSLIRTIFNPFSHIPRLKQIENKPHFVKKIAKFKKQNQYSYITCWFVLKIILFFIIIYGLANCFIVLQESGNQVKGFDPYEILGVDESTPVQKIKKAYRKLALKFHPDRNPGDPEANAKFIMISKAYTCLTDEDAKQNCVKFGNPDGKGSFNVGIALPSFLVQKENKVIIMGLVFLMVVIVLPVFLIYYFGEVNKYDEFNMLQESHPFIHSQLNQQLSIKSCVKVLSLCVEFKNLKTDKAKSEKLELLLRQADEDMKKVFMKKKFFNYIKKSMVLIDARITEKKIPAELMDDFRFIMKKVPILVKASVMLGLERSHDAVAKRYPEAFVGANALKSLILFGQYFFQGKDIESQSFEQLGFNEDEIDRIYKKKKKRAIISIQNLKKSEEDRQFLFGLLTPERKVQVEPILSYIPVIEEVSCIVHTAGDKELSTLDILEVIINVKSNRKSNFCTALKYPFLKMEGWYVIVSDNNRVAYLEHFSFENSEEFEIKFNRGPYSEPGNYNLTIHILSDCYFGLDEQRIVKFDIKAAKKVESTEEKEEEHEEDTSFFSRLMKNMMPPEQEELSDKEDEEDEREEEKKTIKKANEEEEEKEE